MFRSIHTSMWSDPKVKALSPEGKLLFLYLITNNNAHVSGIYYLPLVMIAHETGLSLRVLDTLFHTLSDTRMAYRDEEFEVVWVVNMLRYQGSGGQIKKAVEHQLTTLHGCPLVSRFLSHYRDLNIKYSPPRNTLSDTLPDTLSDTRAPVYKEQEQEQEQEQDSDWGQADHLPQPNHPDPDPSTPTPPNPTEPTPEPVRQVWKPRKTFPPDFPRTPPDWFLDWANAETPDTDVTAEWPKMLDHEYPDPKTHFWACARRWMRNAPLFSQKNGARASPKDLARQQEEERFRHMLARDRERRGLAPE